MCLICLEYEKEKLTSKEAMNALSEVILNETDQDKIEHLYDLANKIIDDDYKLESDSDEDTESLQDLEDFDDGDY